MMREEDCPFWTFDGLRAAAEYLDAIVAGSGNPGSCCAEWQRLSVVSEGSAVCRGRRLLMEVLRATAFVDQLDLKGLCFAESLIRRAIIVRGPHAPGRGSSSHWVSRTSTAGAYPKEFCSVWAKTIAQAAPLHLLGATSVRRDAWADGVAGPQTPRDDPSHALSHVLLGNASAAHARQLVASGHASSPPCVRRSSPAPCRLERVVPLREGQSPGACCRVRSQPGSVLDSRPDLQDVVRPPIVDAIYLGASGQTCTTCT